MPNFEKLNEMKKASGMTTQQIADRSGVPFSTVSRIFTGRTENPNFVTIRDLVKAMGGSLDDLAGIEVKRPEPIPENKETVETLREELANKKRWINRLAVFGAVMTFVLIALVVTALIVDLTVPDRGFFWMK